ncbi:MAG: signal peptidase I [Candidatus Mcinerneyibacterium aminivorans]|uniref:Signal peptidase I n=1 Tax=Candidatus Mcinerneyibacterium aminivorans TaxID=2703815 RepID=A0A5D0MFS2_9BACT|nr:MAG: signal peptidase I [Candidatus Mcinerneyibacterium aminivorans]
MAEPEFVSTFDSGVIYFISIIFYLYYALCLMVVAQKTSTEHPWLSFIPVLNLYLMCRVARKPAWWIILFFIPLVNIVIYFIVLYNITIRRDKPGWWTIMYFLPFVNIVFWGLLAFKD